MRPNDRTLRKLGLSFVTEAAGISEYRLDCNGLKILLSPDPTARSVVVVQHVRVGSRHEGAGNTGYSHLLEHMLFKGTPTHNKAKGNSYDDFVKALGNIMNATTSNDRTNYFAKIPSHALGEYLEHEADRLRNAIITDEDLATEMPVVVDEFDIGENSPDELLMKLLNATAFTEHPYKVDTIGSKSEVLQVTAASLKDRLYNVYYWPNNTTLIIVGCFDEEEALRHVVRCYGSIPPSPHKIPEVYTLEPQQFGERRFVINKPGDLARVGIAFHVPEADHDDHYALAALATVLGGTLSSRLHRKLVDTGLCSADGTGTYLPEWHDASLFYVFAKLAPGVSPRKVERIILREIEKLKKTLIAKRDLASMRRLNRNGTVMGRANRLRWAMSLSSAEACADWKWRVNYDDNFDKVTREDIRRVAQTYLHADNRTVGYFLPKEEPASSEAAGNASEATPDSQQQSAETADTATPAAATGSDATVPAGEAAADQASTPEAAAGNPLTAAVSAKTSAPAANYSSLVRKVVLGNGLTVLLMPTPTETATGFALTVNAGIDQAPASKRSVAALTAKMLTRGSARYSKKRINELSSEMQIRYEWKPQTFGSRLYTHVPPAEFSRFLDMVADSLLNPTFDAAELELVKTQVLAQLDEAATDPGDRALAALSQALYDSSSPYCIKDVAVRKATVSSVEVGDLAAFHKAAYGPQGAVLTLVGHFDVDAMLKLVEAKFGSWTGGKPVVAQTYAAKPDTSGKTRINVDIAGKDNLTILVGLPSSHAMSAPDYLAAVLANKALGGDTLTSRLGYEIREKRGLTYGVTSEFADDTAGGALWLVQMTTNGEKLERAIPLIGQVVEQFVREGISEKELAVEKSSLINSLALQLDAPVDVAAALSRYEFAGVGIAALDAFESGIASLTVAQVNQSIRKHFRLSEAVTVVAGSLPESVKAA
jgi:zinc protease